MGDIERSDVDWREQIERVQAVADEIRSRSKLDKDEAFTLTLLDVIVERSQLQGAVDHIRESRIARARGLAQAIAECRDDARLDGIREGAAEIVTLLGGQ
jgi:hypothetical protein